MAATGWSSDRWSQIQAILAEALILPSAERERLLAARCGNDPSLREEVEAFLALESEIGEFIEEPCLKLRVPEPTAGQDAGRRLGPYRLERQIGSGGMGQVYLAVREDDYQAQVAIKLIHGHGSDEIARRFVHERRILAQLEHPFIARLLDGGTTDDGRPYFVMEHVEGERIDHYCDTRAYSIRQRLELFSKVCEAVAFAHLNLVVHRDIKPSNILVTEDAIPKLLDFGVAKLLATESAPETTTGLAPMTLSYASPEQLMGEAITTASDLYSLGVLLYSLLTGRLPWDLDLATAPSLRPASGEPPRRASSVVVGTAIAGRPELAPEVSSRARGCDPRGLKRQLQGDLDAIVLKTLCRDPAERYGSAAELAAEIQRHLDGLPVAARHGTLWYPFTKFVWRRKVEILVAAALLALGVGLARSTLQTSSERQRVETVVAFLEETLQSPDPRQKPNPRRVIDQAKERLAKSLGDEPELQARVLETLGRTYGALGSLEIAESLIDESLEIQRRLYGGDDPRVAETMFNLGYMHRWQDEIPEAQLLMRTALDNLRRHFDGRDDRRLALALNNYAGLLQDLGELAEAETLYRESLEMKYRLVGQDDLQVARGLSNLGTLLESQGRTEEAATLFHQALEIRRTKLEPNAADLVQSLQHVARLSYHRGAYQKAADLFREVADQRRQIFGEDHLEVAKSLNNLAVCLHRLGDTSESETLFRKVLEIRLRELGAAHHDVAVSRRNLANLLLDLGQPDAASKLAQQALTSLQATRPEDYWRLADTRSVLGAVLTAQSQFVEAEPLLITSHRALLEQKGPSSVYTRDARQRLVELYEAWGKPPVLRDRSELR